MDRLSWIDWGGFEPNSTWKIAHVCINSGEIEKLDWQLSTTTDDSKYDCFDKRYFELGCNNCCPDFELYKTMIEDTIDCCISIDSAYVACGDSVQYFKIQNDVEIPVTLPYELCDDNSDLRFKVKIYNADTLYCTKFFDFNSEIENCSKCNNLHYELMKDEYYMGSGCKYIINRVYGIHDFEGSIYTKDIEYGKYVNGTYTKIETMDYADYDDWEYTMTSCKIDTLVFKLIKDSTILCETEYIVQCKTCEDIDVDSLRGYKKGFIYGGPPPNEIYYNGCCIDIEVMNPDSGSCDFYGLFETGNGVRNNIDITNYQDKLLKGSKDTLTICDAYSSTGNGLVEGYFAIYDQFGNLLCTFFYEHLCEGSPYGKEVNENASFDLEQILVNGNNFDVEIGNLEDLEYQIHSLEGKLLYKEDIANNSKNRLTISTVGLNSGVYSLYIKSGNKQIVKIFKVVR